MNILINASNVKKGGALQVAHSFIYGLIKFPDYNYTIVLSKELNNIILKNNFPSNFHFLDYTIKPSLKKLLFGENHFLDSIVMQQNIEGVISIFGPTFWKPAVKHICTFARGQYIYTESPFFKKSIYRTLRSKLKGIFILFSFKRSCDVCITENRDVSQRLKELLPNKNIYTVTNYYNQIFDQKEKWDKSITLPTYSGTTLLTVSANYEHKNLQIIPKVALSLKKKDPNFVFRFVVTINKEELIMPREVVDNIICIGKVNVQQCPYLYEQSDFMFLPTLLECFSASYPEAMIMRKPILTSDLNFARGLCNDAAVYFDPLNPEDIADKIISLSQSEKMQEQLINNGLNQLKEFDTSEERVEKYLSILVNG